MRSAARGGRAGGRGGGKAGSKGRGGNVARRPAGQRRDRSAALFCVRMTVEYEGTRYRGWQIQKNARTAQGEISAALRGILGTGEFDLQGAGRTDAGVHALEQVAHLRTASRVSPPEILRELNGRLPHDINVLDIRPAQPDFHARHDALSRSYLYQICGRRTAFAKRHVWWVESPLSVESMSMTARVMEGMHDFRSFSDADPDVQSTRVQIEGITVGRWGDLVLIRVRGSHFIWKLVRRIVGVLVASGKGELDPAAVSQFLEEDSGVPARLTAPASGLFLERVFYRRGEKDGDLLPALFASLSRRSGTAR